MPAQAVIAAHGSRAQRASELSTEITAMVRSRAPLRLGLAGGGTDVSPFCDLYGGLVLNATIDRYCYATIEGRRDGEVHFVAADRLERTRFGEGPQPLRLHEATYLRMCADFDLGGPALTITTVADAPPGSGLGSSSALVVSLVEAFREYFALPLGEYEVARLAYQIERVDCGMKGGRQDQYAAAFGGFNSIEFSAGEDVIVNPLRIKDAIVNEFEASLVLFHTGVSRASEDIIEQQTSHVENHDLDRIDATLELKDEAVEMKQALLVGDFHRVAEVIERGWIAKQRLAEGISTSTIERAFDVARASGALAGKISGAGGGGYIMFVVEPLRRPELLLALKSVESGSIEPCHFVNEGATAWRLR